MSAQSKPGCSLAGCMLHCGPHHQWSVGRMLVGSPAKGKLQV